MNVTDLQEIWQVDIGTEIYETNFEVLTQWVTEGSVLAQDKVRRGNLRWIEARKVPSLVPFFNARDHGLQPPVLSSTTNAQTAFHETPPSTQPLAPPTNNFANPYQTSIAPPTTNFQNSAPSFENFEQNAFPPSEQTHYVQAGVNPFQNQNAFQNHQSPVQNVCAMHPETPAFYVCETCANGFCKLCPKSYGGTVKICPFCGALCHSIDKLVQKEIKTVEYQYDMGKGFGFEDFVTALGYPFRFKSSLIFGAILFMIFTLGQSASAIGGIFLVAASLICLMLSNMMTFGVLTNVLDNFSQGRIGVNFMPSFDDFSLWDDMVHPFFLSIAVYLVSFGLFLAIIFGALLYTIKTAGSLTGNSTQSQFLQDQENPFQNNPDFQRQNELYGDGEMPEQGQFNQQPVNPAMDEEERFRRLNEDIQQQRKRQLESGIGKSPETLQKEREEMAKSFLKIALPILLLAGLAFLWGLFYLPAACMVAGYTRSFWATLNPKIGLETIKILGVDYVKILCFAAIIGASMFVTGIILGIIFFPFNLPGVGNIPANIVASFFAFYFSVVFSVTLGFALYKNSQKLQLFRS